MLWIKKVYLVSICVMITQDAMAQRHANVWFRGTMAYIWNHQFKIENELQYRQQQGFEQKYLPDQNLMFAYRLWLQYQLNKNVNLSLSPIAYFSNYKIIKSKLDENKVSSQEWRYTIAGDFNFPIKPKLYFIERSALELRTFESDQKNIVRWRNKVGLRFAFNNTLSVGISDELLLNVSNVSGMHLFDHNRVGANVIYSPFAYLKFDLGYLFIKRLPLSKDTFLQENNFYINLYFALFRN